MSKSIKLDNDTYIDSSGIAHNRETLKEILNTYNNRKILEWKSESSKNFDDFKTPGIYSMSGTYSNSYASSSSRYGLILILTSTGKTWAPSDSESWIWQIVFDTDGSIYKRIATNSSTFSSWKTLH